MQTYATWLCLPVAAHAREFAFAWPEPPLLPLNFRLVFLHRSPESFAAGRNGRLKASGKPDQYTDAVDD